MHVLSRERGEVDEEERAQYSPSFGSHASPLATNRDPHRQQHALKIQMQGVYRAAPTKSDDADSASDGLPHTRTCTQPAHRQEEGNADARSGPDSSNKRAESAELLRSKAFLTPGASR